MKSCAARTSGRRSTASPAPVPDADACLFLDVDGTLLDFALTPDGVGVDAELIDLLRATSQRTCGALALVSGRTIDDLDRLFAPLRLPAAGVHGYERRDARGTLHRQTLASKHLQSARAELEQLVAAHAGLLLEDKQSALALHYRRAPQLEALVRHKLAQLQTSLLPDFELLAGDAVLEIKPGSHSKASAVEAFLREAPFAGRLPIFLGDDVTDRDGFAAVLKHGGLAIAVGDRVSAQWRLPDPAAVRGWLRSFVERQEQSP